MFQINELEESAEEEVVFKYSKATKDLKIQVKRFKKRDSSKEIQVKRSSLARVKQ